MDQWKSNRNFFLKNGYIILNDLISSQICDRIRKVLVNANKMGKKPKQGRHKVHKVFFEQCPEVLDLLDTPLFDFAQNVIASVPAKYKDSLDAHLFHCNAYSIPPRKRTSSRFSHG